MWYIRYSVCRHHIEGVCTVTYWQGTETESLGWCAYCKWHNSQDSVPIMTTTQLTICNIINRNQHVKIINRLSCLSAFTGCYFARGPNNSPLCCFTLIKSMPGAVWSTEFSLEPAGANPPHVLYIECPCRKTLHRQNCQGGCPTFDSLLFSIWYRANIPMKYSYITPRRYIVLFLHQTEV